MNPTNQNSGLRAKRVWSAKRGLLGWLVGLVLVGLIGLLPCLRAEPKIITQINLPAFGYDTSNNITPNPIVYSITNGMWILNLDGSLSPSSNINYDCIFIVDSNGNLVAR